MPGLRRDVLFACTADEEAGGRQGAGWLAEHRPETLRAAGALSEAGGVSVEVGGRRFYPIQVAEKGYEVYRIRVRGTWGHGSMPRDDNAAVLAAEAVTRLARPGEPRVTRPLRRLLDALVTALPEHAELVEGIGSDDPRRSDAALRALCDPANARVLRALLRDTISPDVIHAGTKYNVIPGEAEIELDCRTLPGTTEGDVREEIVARLGDLAPRCTIEHTIGALPVEAPADGPLYDRLVAAIRAHDPEGIPVPMIVPFASDAKHTATLGVPTYGFSPLRQAPGEHFLERFHATDERVGLEALRWGLPVLYDVVAGFCGRSEPRRLRRQRPASSTTSPSAPGMTVIASEHELQRKIRRSPHQRSASCSTRLVMRPVLDHLAPRPVVVLVTDEQLGLDEAILVHEPPRHACVTDCEGSAPPA